MDAKSLARRRCIWASALTLTTLWAQLATVVMVTAPADKAQWNDQETKAFVDYLLEHKSEIGDAGSFKMGTFNATAEHISVHHTTGPIKTGKMCQTKWRAVCII